MTTVPPVGRSPLSSSSPRLPLRAASRLVLPPQWGPRGGRARPRHGPDALDGCRREVEIVGVLCASGDDVGLLAELAGPGAPVVVQEGMGLGGALQAGVRDRSLGGLALLVSSDIPGVPPGALLVPSALLRDGADVVLGPGYDGGYWLIGMRHDIRGFFDGIPWSTRECSRRRWHGVGRARSMFVCSSRGVTSTPRTTSRRSPIGRTPCPGGGCRTRSPGWSHGGTPEARLNLPESVAYVPPNKQQAPTIR